MSGTLHGVETQLRRAFRTDAQGLALVRDLAPGRYQMRVAKDGFAAFSRVIELSAASETRTVTLSVGGSSYEVNVVGATPLGGLDRTVDEVPAPVQTANARDIERASICASATPPRPPPRFHKKSRRFIDDHFWDVGAFSRRAFLSHADNNQLTRPERAHITLLHRMHPIQNSRQAKSRKSQKICICRRSTFPKSMNVLQKMGNPSIESPRSCHLEFATLLQSI